MVNNVYNISLLNDTQIAQIEKDTDVCLEMTRQCVENPANGTICFDAQSYCFEVQYLPFYATKRNPYDIREVCESPRVGICYGMEHVYDFFNLEGVREYLNVSDGPVAEWVEASDKVGEDFERSVDYSFSYDTYVADLLDGGIRVLIYTGDADLMCNWQGNHAWTSALEWSGKQGFNAAEERAFIAHDPLDVRAPPQDAGLLRSFENFAVLRVFNAGHMVPAHQPAASLDMINKFFANQQL